MIFAEDTERFSHVAEDRARRNTIAFMEHQGLDRQEIEALAARIHPGQCTIYFVSTIPAGLAGSKSDVDVILVPDSASGSDAVSNMMFHRDRRIGAKVILATEIAHALDRLREFSSHSLLGRCSDVQTSHSPGTIKWEDLTRLVNGLSFAQGATYLPALPDIARYATACALAKYRQQRFAAKLADRSNAVDALFGYRLNAVISAMDALMSACGRIMSNSKWTLQRWQQFEADPLTDAARSLHLLISQTWNSVLQSPRADSRTLTLLDERFDEMTATEQKPFRHRLRPLSSAICREFLPGALSIKSNGHVAIVPSNFLDRLASIDMRDPPADLSRTEAASILRLWQLEMLETVDETQEHRQ